jgi:hypothetical protein
VDFGWYVTAAGAVPALWRLEFPWPTDMVAVSAIAALAFVP